QCGPTSAQPMLPSLLLPAKRGSQAAIVRVRQTSRSFSAAWLPHTLCSVSDVVASLITPSDGERLRGLSVPPQRVRSKHVHRAELAAGELLPMLIHNPFKDPSFDEMISELSRISRVCLIEWLRCKGDYKLVRLPKDDRSSFTNSIPGVRGGGGKKRHLTSGSGRTRRKRRAAERER